MPHLYRCSLRVYSYTYAHAHVECRRSMHASGQYAAGSGTQQNPMAMGIITKRPRERQSTNDGSVKLPQPQLLDSPLPTPRRSCASADSPSLRCRLDASPLRTQVPFSWESSPGVPKSRDAHKAQEMPPPKLPPGRGPPGPSRNWCYGNASEASSDDCDTSSFSGALDRASSPERIGSFDRVTSRRFEDIFVGRATSFAKDRSSRHEHAAAISPASSSGRHLKHWRRHSTRRDDNVERPTARQSNDPVKQVQVIPRINTGRARAEQMSPRACGLMVLFPWRAKPAPVCGFRSPSSHYATTAAGGSDTPPSHSRRSTTTLRDALQEEKETSSGAQELPQQPRGEKRSREEWQGRGWGVSSLFGTSKKYCTDARKALSKLSIALGADSGTPRVGTGREKTSGKQDASTTRSMAAKLTKLKTNVN